MKNIKHLGRLNTGGGYTVEVVLNELKNKALLIDNEGYSIIKLKSYEYYIKDIEENIEEAVGINIYVEKADNTVKVVTNGVELKEILVSDMAGRTITYQVSGYSASLKLPVPIGVYMINVIGDTASRTEKVVLK